MTLSHGLHLGSYDIWAFGCVCYETLTGERAFQGGTVSDNVAKILATEPNWSELSKAPESIQRLIRRCLQKEVNHRLQDIGDARIEIEEILAAPQESIITEVMAAKPKPKAWKRVAQWTAFGLLAFVALFAIWILGRIPGFRIPTWQLVNPVISPDGKWLPCP